MISTPISPNAVRCAVIDHDIYQIDMQSAEVNDIHWETLDTQEQKIALGDAISVEGKEYIIGESCDIEYDSPSFRDALTKLSHVDQISEYVALYFDKLDNLFAIRTTNQEFNMLVQVHMAI